MPSSNPSAPLVRYECRPVPRLTAVDHVSQRTRAGGSAWVYGGTQRRNVLRYTRAIPQSDEHPTPKPVSLLEELIKAASPSRGRVLDPFAGAGPTLIAAERTGRTCYAAELEPRDCDIVMPRWEALTGGAAVKACALPPVPATRPCGSTS